jgi:hypothetical protein
MPRLERESVCVLYLTPERSEMADYTFKADMTRT